MNCHPLIHATIRHTWPHAYRAIRRRMRRHAVRAVGAVVTIVCLGPPAVVLLAPPVGTVMVPTPMVMRPVDVPEPAGVWVVAVGLVGLVVVRGCVR